MVDIDFDQRIRERLQAEVDPGAEGRKVAMAVALLLEDIGSRLSPILGPRGVAALYKRSLFVSSKANPALAGLHEGVDNLMDLSPLADALAPLAAARALSEGTALITEFCALLASLIGASLTERLLRSLWAPMGSKRAPDVMP